MEKSPIKPISFGSLDVRWSLLARAFLIISVFAIFPSVVVHIALRQIDRLETDARIQMRRKDHERALPVLKKLDDDFSMINRAIKRTYERMKSLPDERRTALFRRIVRIFKGQMSLYFFSDEGKIIPGLFLGDRPKKVMEQAFEIFRTAKNEKALENRERNLLIRLFKAPGISQAVEYRQVPMVLALRATDSHIIWHAEDPGISDENASNSAPPSTNSRISGYIVLLNREAMPENRAIKLAMNRFNRKSDQFKVGYADLNAGEIAVYPEIFSNDRELRNGILAANSSYDQSFSIGNRFVTMMVRKDASFFFAIEDTPKVFSDAVFTLLDMACLLWLIFVAIRAPEIGRGFSAPIPLKLSALFIFAVGIPSMILLTYGYYALKDQNTVLRNNLEHKLIEMLAQFDERFPEEKARFEKWNAAMIRRIDSASDEATRRLILDEMSENTLVNGLNVIPAEGELTYFFKSGGESSEESVFMRHIGHGILKRFYAESAEDEDPKKLAANAMQEDLSKIIFTSFGFNHEKLIQSLSKLVVFRIPENLFFYVVSDIIGDGSSERPRQIVMVVLLQVDLERRYCERNLPLLMKNPFLSLKAATFSDPAKYSRLPSPDSDPLFKCNMQQIEKIAAEAKARRSAAQIMMDSEGEECLWVALRGSTLERNTLVAWTPVNPLSDEIKRRWKMLWAVAFLVFFATAVIGWILSEQFLLPLNDISKGIEAVGRRDFAHRVTVFTEDELGRMAKLLNKTIEGMEELEIARIVQENLLPAAPLMAGEYAIEGKSRAMTDVGGDYFDYLQISDNRILGLLGDVSGHGISAALIMGLAKGALTSDNAGEDIVEMLESFNRFMIRTIKKAKMMTLFVYKLDTVLHKMEFANGGQNYPLICSSAHEAVEPVHPKLSSFPVGILKKPGYKSFTRDIMPGDTLLMFTDGFVEAQNPSGEALGDDRLRQWFRELHKLPPGMIIEGLFSRFDEFTSSSQIKDDVTLVCLKRAP